MEHEALIEEAKAAIDEVNSDISVSQDVTLSSLRDIQEHLGALIEALKDTME